MKNPFNPQNLGEAKLKRNVFDLGRNSIFTNDFFKLYPFFCQEILPGDTVRIDAQIGVRGMPTVFPVQTKCRASMEFYYVRNRTLMDNFEDYIFMTKDIEAPWLRLNNERAKKMISVGSLGDAFNVPTTHASGSRLFANVETQSNVYFFNVGQPNRQRSVFFDDTLDDMISANFPFSINSDSSDVTYRRKTSLCYGYLTSPFDNAPLDGFFYADVQSTTEYLVGRVGRAKFVILRNSDNVPMRYGDCYITVVNSETVDSHYNYTLKFEFGVSNSDYIKTYYDLSENNKVRFAIVTINDVLDSDQTHYILSSDSPFFNYAPTSNDFIADSFDYVSLSSGVIDATDNIVIDNNPFVGVNPDIRLNALPWRAYEMICNYYYRNDKNNPYVLNGESQYNEFIPTHASGPDDNLYDFHYRNWELDRFTSAIQSPQFGEAPLVGLTYSPTSPTADLTFQASLDGGATQDYTVKVGVNSDGNIDSIVDFDSDVPSANLQRLQRQIQAGISINDLRITNSFQRFLENTIRRGLRYRNQLKSHFGVSVDYPDIDVPQYIGGASGFLESGQVTNMADSPNAGLGDYVGTLQGGISMSNKITHYCAEHGFIIGIFSLAPIPNYPQSISKVMLKTNPLDYYLPEFGKIGYVPIHYSELMPLQTPADGSVDDVFGYQKAHYDYMQAFDEVHGDFRTNLRNFVVSRTFKERPLLSSSFTVGSPEQLNDIWVANNIADAYGSTAKFMCSSHVSCIMKREVAMIGTPSLE